MTRALICGVSGQDGACLAELLLSKGYEAWGTSRDAQVTSFKNIEGALDIAAGARGPLRLGNLEVSRDWGWSPEYVKAAATQRSACRAAPGLDCPQHDARRRQVDGAGTARKAPGRARAGVCRAPRQRCGAVMMTVVDALTRAGWHQCRLSEWTP